MTLLWHLDTQWYVGGLWLKSPPSSKTFASSMCQMTWSCWQLGSVPWTDGDGSSWQRGFPYRILKLAPITAKHSPLLAFCLPYPQFSLGALLSGKLRSSADSIHPALQRDKHTGSGSTATGRVLQCKTGWTSHIPLYYWQLTIWYCEHFSLENKNTQMFCGKYVALGWCRAEDV